MSKAWVVPVWVRLKAPAARAAVATRTVGGLASAVRGGLAARDWSGQDRYPRKPVAASASRASQRRPWDAGRPALPAAELSPSDILALRSRRASVVEHDARRPAGRDASGPVFNT
ncbi:hypothetical protein GCM10007890_62470 [Methylobacterium tardum]|uniref:Uncharacterized protein n=1 Tax=Methylobacterium tardum TaxID=374432 RepID=A0AA37WWM4_9HYPH|nr:hypothetical protein GCM10007890_62470 [Methylobacterium tardum]